LPRQFAGEVASVLQTGAELGEGPVWDARDSLLLWVDLHKGRFHRYDPVSGQADWRDVGQALGAVMPREREGYVLAVHDGFATLDAFRSPLRTVALVEADRPDNRMNDGACDTRGRFWAGTMADDSAPHAGALYRLSADGHVTEVLRGTSVSNGIGWNPEDDRMYYIDSAERRVDVFAWEPDAGHVSQRRVLIETTGMAGVPDGLAVDEEGCIWVAFFGGGCVRRFTSSGILDLEVHLPVTQVTSCAFGGSGLDVLYITTARRGLPAKSRVGQPHAGDVFAVDAGVRGVPCNLFAG